MSVGGPGGGGVLPPPSPVMNDGSGSGGLPVGFVPLSITDSVTGVVTPLSGMSALPSLGGNGNGTGNGGGERERRTSIYGNPNPSGDDGAADWGGGGWGSNTPGGGGGTSSRPRSPYTSSSASALPTGPPVIPGEYTPGGSQRPRTSIYGTPGGSGSRSLAGGTPVGGGVYQNPLRQDEEGEEGEGEDELLARNTKINATAPLPGVRKKKKKGGR